MTERLAEVNRWLSELAGNDAATFELETIAGGASPRRFHRVRPSNAPAKLDGLGSPDTAIVMEVPPDTGDVVFARGLGRPWPFLEVRALLESRGVRVPRLYAQACERDLLLVEDLGETLAGHLAARPEERERLYSLAVRGLARAQSLLDPLPPDSVIRLRAFDERLLGDELEHFREWGLEARGITLDDAGRRVFDEARAVLVATLAALARGFVHRDYQSRNLLVVDGGASLGWIDFQDALLGPRAYDLVALLCDSYQPFDRAFVERRLDEYAAERALSPYDRLALGREFDLATVQRKLKDAGRFVFIEKRRGDASFLPFVPPTLAIVRQALVRVSDVPQLRDLLDLLDGLGVFGPSAE
jgi:N-acetylmuramate 1-kinase